MHKCVMGDNCWRHTCWQHTVATSITQWSAMVRHPKPNHHHLEWNHQKFYTFRIYLSVSRRLSTECFQFLVRKVLRQIPNPLPHTTTSTSFSKKPKKKGNRGKIIKKNRNWGNVGEKMHVAKSQNCNNFLHDESQAKGHTGRHGGSLQKE